MNTKRWWAVGFVLLMVLPSLGPVAESRPAALAQICSLPPTGGGFHYAIPAPLPPREQGGNIGGDGTGGYGVPGRQSRGTYFAKLGFEDHLEVPVV